MASAQIPLPFSRDTDLGRPAEARVRGTTRGGYIRGDRFAYIGVIRDGWQEVPLAECGDVVVHGEVER